MAVQMFFRLHILAEFVFSGFIQVRLVAQTVSSKTAMLELSYSTISGLIVCLKTESVLWNAGYGRSTAKH